MKKLFTSESVTEGHPDKVCDLISDSVLDAMLEQDPNSRVACETCANENFVMVMGEITSNAKVNVEEIVRNAIREIGYTKEEYGFNADTCEIKVMLKKQSSDIAMGVNSSLEEKSGEDELGEGAGDQGIIFGYACNETESYMPAPIHYAHKLAERLTFVRKSGLVTYLRPDGKTQVTIEYDGDKVKRVDTIVVSTQQDDNIEHGQIEKDIIEHVIKPIIPEELLDENTKYYINPTGRFVIGGPVGDSGLTGRKIIVDTYGGYAPHGGGAFSGKDPTKVDRSAAYMMRKIAKDIVKQGLADKCQIQVAYAIGVAKPVSVCVDTYGTGKVSNEEILEKIQREYDMTPKGIMKTLDLRKPIYKTTTNYGHFGKEHLSWEQ